MIYIYGLRCPIEGVIRYVGKSVNPRKRRAAHIGSAVRREYNHHTARWIRGLVSSGYEPELVILREMADEESWQDVERAYIAGASDRGWKLTNSTAGGEGLDYRDPELKRAYRAKLSNSLKKVWNTPENRERAKQRSLKAWADKEVTERRVASMREAARRPDVRARNLEVLASLAKREDVKGKKSAASASSWTGESGERRRKAASADESRSKLSRSAKARWSDPVKGKAAREANASPERRAKLAEKARLRATPEYRAMMAEKTRRSWDARRAKKGIKDGNDHREEGGLVRRH